MMNFGSFDNVGVAEAKKGSSKRLLMSEASNDMTAGAMMTQPRLAAAAAPPRAGPGPGPGMSVNMNMNMNVYSTPKLSLALRSKWAIKHKGTTRANTVGQASGLEGKCEMLRGGGESHHGKPTRDDGCESRSGSDNMDAAGSGDDQDGDNQPARKKRYHRHTPQQIQEMEALFKECPHPDEKQRQILSVQLGLAPRQIKFWFQNRRTQMKAQHERHENSILRQENEKLRVDNLAIREAMRNPICTSCGGPAVLREMSLGEQQLRIENARLRDELDRVCVIAGKFYGRPFPPLTSLPPMHSSSLDLAVGGGNGFEAAMQSSLDPGMEFQQGPSVGLRTGGAKGGMERSMMAELAIAAMDELMKMAQMEEPLWIPSLEDGKETLNYEEYLRQFPRGIGFGSKPLGYKTEATRQVGVVIMNSLNLVETFMDATRCTEMFPCIVSRAATVDVISNGMNGTRNGALQLMYMELQVLSPLVPTREVYFLRFSQQHAEGVWAVVDVSLDGLRENLPATLMKCRRRPSGCLIQDMPNGYSKVTWVEHAEYDDRAVHDLYRSLVNSGMAFGSQRWLATLQRQCERLAILMATNVPAREPTAIPTPAGRRSMLRLAQRMTNNFCAGVSASTVQTWTKLSGNGDDDIRVTTRKSVDDPGEPSGVVLSAATSVWLPVSPQRLFEFLRDERLRSEWDILSNGGPMQEMAHIAKGQDPGNSVSLLGASAMNANQSNMLILQESCTDASGSLVVYAPVDIPAMNLVMNGGDSSYVSLLPSGFAILPDGPECRPLTLTATGSSLDTPRVGGSLLTVAFQILVNSLPTAKLTMESVETVNNLISCTVQKIKSALHCEDA